MTLDTLAQLLWSADDDATEPSWGFVNMKRRGKYRHMAKAAQEALQGREMATTATRINVVGEGPPHEFWADEWTIHFQDSGETLAIVGWGDGTEGQRRRAARLMADLKALIDIRDQRIADKRFEEACVADEWYADA